HELPDTEDGVRELTQGESGDARADAEARAGREGEERPVEVEVLAREAARQRLVVRGGVVRIAGRTADGGGDLVAERDLDAEARADALAVARPETATVSRTATTAPTSPRFTIAPPEVRVFEPHWLKSARQSRAAPGGRRDFRAFSRSRNVAVTFARETAPSMR